MAMTAMRRSKVVMTGDSKITEKTTYRHGRKLQGKAVAMTVLIAAAMLVLSCCQRKPVMAHAYFIHLPSSGWQQSNPLNFKPEYDDSTLTYSISLAVRHENSYRFSNLLLLVDLIAVDSTVTRQKVDMKLADEYGNWRGGGFGSLYQETVGIADVIAPEDARAVVVWQTMQGCDTLQGLDDVGIIVRPLRGAYD